MRVVSRLFCGGLLSIFAITDASAQKVQQNGVAIWQMPAPTLNAMLTSVPTTDAARYEELRKLFVGFGCNGEALEEELPDHNLGIPNLLCKLPGQVPQPILVIASYTERQVYKGNSRAWPDAVMLPALYYAISAEAHHYTYLFAAVAGDEGGRKLFHQLRRNDEPVVLVELNALGFSEPSSFTVPPGFLPSKLRSRTLTLEQKAWQVAHYQGIDIDSNGFAGGPVFGMPDSIFSGEPQDWPRLYVFSTPGEEMMPHYFRQAYDFLAFFLASLDNALAAPVKPPPAIGKKLP